MEFWVDFSGYCLVKANSREEAREKFEEQGPYCAINEPVYEVTGVEEKDEENN